MLASHLHLSVDRCKQETSSSQFIDWMVFLELERNFTTKQDVYLAQIAQEVQRSYVAEPNKVKLKSFIRKFKTMFENENDLTEEEVDSRTEASKSFWLKALGIRK